MATDAALMRTYAIADRRKRGVKRLEILLAAVRECAPIRPRRPLPRGYMLPPRGERELAERALNRVFTALSPLQSAWGDWGDDWAVPGDHYDSQVRHRLFDPDHEPSWTVALTHAHAAARYAQTLAGPPRLLARAHAATAALAEQIGDGSMDAYVRAALGCEFPRDALRWPTALPFAEWAAIQSHCESADYTLRPPRRASRAAS